MGGARGMRQMRTAARQAVARCAAATRDFRHRAPAVAWAEGLGCAVGTSRAFPGPARPHPPLPRLGARLRRVGDPEGGPGLAPTLPSGPGPPATPPGEADEADEADILVWESSSSWPGRSAGLYTTVPYARYVSIVGACATGAQLQLDPRCPHSFGPRSWRSRGVRNGVDCSLTRGGPPLLSEHC